MMKKFGMKSLKAAVAASVLAGLPAGAALAQPILSVSLNGGDLGDILSVEVIGPKGPLAVSVAGNQLPFPTSIDPSNLGSLLDALPDTGTPLDGLADMIPADALPVLPADPVGVLAGLVPAGGGGGGAPALPGLPDLPVDVVGTVTGLVPAGGGAPGLPALPVDVVGTVTGLIPAGGGVPDLPALPIDVVGTITSLIPAGGGTPGLPALPIDIVGTVTSLIPAGGGTPGLPALPVDVVGTVTGLIPAGGADALPVGTLVALIPVDALPVPLP